MQTAPLPCLVVFCDPAPAPDGVRLPLRERLLEAALRAFLRPGFRHCFVLVPVLAPAFQGWVQVDPLFCGTNVALTAPETRAWIEAQAQAGTLHFAWAHPVRELRVQGLAPLTCVSVVKAVLGRSCRALTPFQLYRHLKREESTMGGFFGGGQKAPAPDNSAMEEQLAQQREDRQRLERENAAKRRSRRTGTGAAGLRWSGTADLPAAGAAPAKSDTLGG